jgi:hypothetical protein
MFNHITEAKTFVMAASTLAIALFTIGMGVNSTWAGSDQPSGLKFTSISSEGVYRSGREADKARRFTQVCMHFHEECSIPPDMRFPCCAVNTCQPNPNANGRTWCIGDVK